MKTQKENVSKTMATVEFSEDGTLVVHVQQAEKISRVFVIGDDRKGDIFYPDED